MFQGLSGDYSGVSEVSMMFQGCSPRCLECFSSFKGVPGVFRGFKGCSRKSQCVSEGSRSFQRFSSTFRGFPGDLRASLNPMEIFR